ncbi:MAG: peptidase rane alanine aminopeptidase, partial [Acidobacteriaceae bacterium]|nr:peptidase rane alanine aminopeptidase [Acidobacteriaceae bacterium]
MVSARLLQRASRLSIALLLVLAPLCLQAAEKARLRADDYVIDAELFPATHKLVAHAKVKVTAIDDISVAVFELHNGLRPTKITNAAGQTLSGERVTQDSTLRIPLPAGLPKGTSTIFNFDYEGTLSSADDSPVEGLKLAYIGDGISYLLYAGRWFPTLNYGINRFTATMNITAPAAMRVVGSGKATLKPAGTGKTTHTFVWEKPSFPGTIIAGVFNETTANVGGVNIRTFFLPAKKEFAPVYAETAEKEFEFYSSTYGPPLSTDLNIVELPDDTVPSAWAPEIAGLASRAISAKTNYRLLANAIAHQWWGVSASPATRDDFWLQDGFARYSEVRYVEHAAGSAGFEEACKDMAVGALAYDTIPLSSAGKLELFSPEFQSLTSDKGAMILHMLRWEMGDAAFDKTMRAFATQSVGKAVRAEDFA